MKATILKEPGGTEHFEKADIDIPQIDAKEVLIEVKAISINPVDAKTRSGKGLYEKLKDHKPLILGWDISGIISKTGADVSEFKVGDEVFGMVNFPGHGRAYADYVAAPADHLALKPENISHEEAAATTLAALTAWQDLTHKGNVKQGQKVLIHGASGGVGHFAIQMAKYLEAEVIGTCSASHKDMVLELGADQHIDYRTEDFTKAVSNVDFVLDTVGGENTERSMDVMKNGGRLIVIAGGLTEEAEHKAKLKNIKASREMVTSSGEDMRKLAELLREGIVKAHVFDTYDLEQISEAHAQVESGHTTGKIILNPSIR